MTVPVGNYPAPPAVGDPVRAGIIAAILGAVPVSDSGSVTITPTAANTPTSAAVTFTPGRFSAAPSVQLTAHTTVPGTNVTGVGVTGISATGCTVWVTRTSTSPTSVDWLAVLTP